MADAGLLGDHAVLSDWDVLPAQLSAALERASALVVLDMFSFPFESLTGDLQDVPLILLLPPGFDAGFLATVFGQAAFARLGFFDRIAAQEHGLWESCAGGTTGRRASASRSKNDRPEHAAAEISAALEAESALHAPFGDGDYEADRYWTERGDALAGGAPHRAVCSVNHGPRFNKAIHRVQATALLPQFAAARGTQAEEVPFDVLEVGVGVGRWAASFDPARTRFTGVDISEGHGRGRPHRTFPRRRFDRLGDEPILPYGDESFDLVVQRYRHAPQPDADQAGPDLRDVAGDEARRAVDVPGGLRERRVVVEVHGIPDVGVEFVELLVEATAGQVVLEHIESVRYQHDDFTRGGLLSVSKLGVAKTW